jgi:hypothetical protein
MTERVPRSLLALTVIVVVVALYVGVKDYVQQKNAPPQASTSTPTVVDSNAKTVEKKTTSARTRRTRMHATERHAAATGQVAPDASEKSRINEESSSAAPHQVVNDNASNTVMAADDAEGAAMGQDNQLRNKLDGKTAMSALTAQCVPLPNVTNPEDVDAHYYRNWAREYWCYDSTRSAAATRN